MSSHDVPPPPDRHSPSLHRRLPNEDWTQSIAPAPNAQWRLQCTCGWVGADIRSTPDGRWDEESYPSAALAFRRDHRDRYFPRFIPAEHGRPDVGETVLLVSDELSGGRSPGRIVQYLDSTPYQTGVNSIVIDVDATGIGVYPLDVALQRADD